jgi:hypothetical protein
VPYLLLASVFLEFNHPESGEPISFSADLPDHMTGFIKKLDRTEIVK